MVDIAHMPRASAHGVFRVIHARPAQPFIIERVPPVALVLVPMGDGRDGADEEGQGLSSLQWLLPVKESQARLARPHPHAALPVEFHDVIQPPLHVVVELPQFAMAALLFAFCKT